MPGIRLLDELRKRDKKTRDGYNGPPTPEEMAANGGFQTPPKKLEDYATGAPLRQPGSAGAAPGRQRGNGRGGRNPESTTPDDGGDQTDIPKNPQLPPDAPVPGNQPAPAPGPAAPMPQNPLTGQMGQFLEMMMKQGNLDTASQAWQLQRAVQEYGEGRPIEDYLLNLYGGDVLGVDFDMPENDASGWINQAMGGTYGQGPTGPGGATGQYGQQYGAGAGLTSGDYAADQATRAAGDAAGERVGRYTESGREKINANHRKVAAAFKYGETLGSLGIKAGEGNGGTMNELWKPGGFYSSFGINAGETWRYRVVNGVLQKQPYENQVGRIQSLAQEGKKGWQPAPEREQASYQKMQDFLAQHPGAGAADFLSYKRLANSVRGPNNKIVAIPGRPGFFQDKGGYQIYDSLGHKIEALTNQGNWQGAGLGEGDYNPDWQQSDRDGAPGGGGGSGSPVGGGIPPGGIANQGGWHLNGNSANPNRPDSFGLLAPQIQGIADDLDSARRDLRNSTISGGERDAALADSINSAYGAKAAAKQGLVQDAAGYLQNLSKEKKFGVPVGGYTGGGASGLQGLLSKYNTDTNYNLGMAGINAASQQNAANNNTSMWGTIGGLLSSLFF